jgi:protein involved in polysaccharide export with SLBB domain
VSTASPPDRDGRRLELHHVSGPLCAWSWGLELQGSAAVRWGSAMLAIVARASRSFLGLWMAAILLVACSAGPRGPLDLPTPVHSTTLGVGDELEIRIAGEEKFATTYSIAPDGTVALPYINRFEIAGLEPHEIEARVRQMLMDREIFTDPSVSVVVKTYRSKKIEIIGEVKKPDSYPLEPGMGLLRAISLAGGFTSLANPSSVTLRRRLPDGSVRVVRISVDAIIDNEIPDVPLQAGDSVNVPKSVF